MNTKTRMAESRRIWLEVMHDAMVEPLLVPDGEVLRVLHDGQGEADKARGNQQLLVCPARWLKDSDVAIPTVFIKKQARNQNSTKLQSELLAADRLSYNTNSWS